MECRAAVVAARVGGVMVVESIIRARLAPVVWGLGLVGGAAVVAAVLLRGWAGLVLAVVGILLLVGLGVVLAMRSAALFTLRRAGAGADYDVVHPVVARHVDQVRSARSAVALGRAGLRGLLRVARRPAEVDDVVREAGAAIVRRVPALVDEVDAVLRRPR